MNKARLWSHILASNPAMSGTTVRLRVTELQRLFDVVWDVATRHTMEQRQHGLNIPDSLKGIFDVR